MCENVVTLFSKSAYLLRENVLLLVDAKNVISTPSFSIFVLLTEKNESKLRVLKKR
jgi:hypothetical protein